MFKINQTPLEFATKVLCHGDNSGVIVGHYYTNKKVLKYYVVFPHHCEADQEPRAWAVDAKDVMAK
jgi:hypothetical protein